MLKNIPFLFYRVIMKLRSGAAIMILLVCNIAVAQVLPFISEKSLSPEMKYSIQTWTTENGLPQNSINDIAQTKDGYLWLATFDGVVKFDGVKFTTYNTSNISAFKTNGIKNLFVDLEDRLWIIGVDGSLTAYLQNEFRSYSLPAKLNIYSNVIVDYLDESILILCSNNKLYQFKNGKFSVLDIKPPGKMNAIESLNTNQLYIAADNGLFSFINKEYHEFTEIKGKKVSQLNHSPFSEVLAETESGLYEVHAGSCKSVYLKPGLTSLLHNSLAFNEEKQLCFLTENGVFFQDGSQVNTASGLSSNSIRSMFVDHERNLWIGTNNGGLNKLKHKLFRSYSKEDGMLSDVCTGITKSKSGEIYIGNNCGGVSEFYKGQFKQGLKPLKDKCVWSVMGDQENNLWVSIYGNGLNKISNDKVTSYSTADGLNSPMVFSFYQDEQKKIWLGTSNGLCYSTPQGFIKTDTGFHQGICYIYKDRNSQIWLGTSAGLAVLENDKIILKDTANGYKRSSVRFIYEDSDRTLWIGYHGEGLARIKNDRIFYFNQYTPLLNKNVWSIAEDINGNLWLPSNSGMYVVDKKELNGFADYVSTEINPVLLTKEDGLKSVEFNGGFQPSMLKDSNGEFWFPTVKGVSVINPLQLFKPHNRAHILIEGARTDATELSLSNGIKLNPDNNSLQITFTCPTFTNPSKIFFEYKIEGLNEDWINNGNSREIRLSKLPPGSYLLKIKAAGNPSISEASIKIVMDAEWWEKPHVVIITSLVLLMMVILTTILIITRVRKSEKLKTQINRQYANIELRALQAQMNPHFIFNCLNSIQHFIIVNDEVSASKYLTKFSMLMRKFLEHSKSNIVTLQEEIELLRLYIELESLRSKHKFNFTLKIDPEIDIFNMEIPGMLFQPFVENSITHGLFNLERKGNLSLTFELEDGYLKGTIEDDGVGRKRSSEINAAVYKDHASRGMEIVKERIRVLNFIENMRIELEVIDKVSHDNVCEGTKVIIKIPI
ncbi:MAG: hypothetical protein K0S44_471 [Bacteroidetes bacterium]|jgi:ligand-binding sensor domain-containing protein|nr:hypothetical protein [Bacteroidota bacterium]